MTPEQILGRNIKTLREQAGLTQGDLARLLNVAHRELISYYETGARNVPLAVIEQVADLFGVAPTELFDADFVSIPVGRQSAYRADALTDEARQAIAAFRRIARNYIKLREDHNADAI